MSFSYIIFLLKEICHLNIKDIQTFDFVKALSLNFMYEEPRHT